MAKLDVVVKPGRTVIVGEATKGAGGKPGKPKKVKHGPGTELTLDEAEAKRLIRAGAVTRVGSEEAKAVKEVTDRIPKDFPGADALAKNGIETFSALAAVEDLVALDGIGEATAEKIEDALEARGAE